MARSGCLLATGDFGVAAGGDHAARPAIADGARRSAALCWSIALIGTVLPGAASFEAVRHLPSGVVSILISLVPIFALPIALCWRLERFAAPRAAGRPAGCGRGGDDRRAARPACPNRAMVVFLPLAMIAPFFYALEGNVVARWGTRGAGSGQAAAGGGAGRAADGRGAGAAGTGQWVSLAPPWGPPNGRCRVGADPCRRLCRLCLAGRPCGGGVRRAGRLSCDAVRGRLGDADPGRTLFGWVWAAMA
jgi:hypothetical protein